MKQTWLQMGMPITVAVLAEPAAAASAISAVYAYFDEVDRAFSPYRADSEVSRLNQRLLTPEALSEDLRAILDLAEQTRQETLGYFDIRRPDGQIDPCGLVKGWAISQAADRLRRRGLTCFYIEAGGDIETAGDCDGRPWRVGIRNPFNLNEIVKVLAVQTAGVATSGNYVRGAHIYNPHQPGQLLDEVVSLTVIGPDGYEADRFATAAFAMGRAGIEFIEAQAGLEGYLIDRHGQATLTSGLAGYVVYD